MRIALILIGIFLSFIAKAQYTPVDSTYTRVSLSYYNQAGYYIGKDSFHRRTVRYANFGDTITRIKYDTLIQRFPQRFITMDSLVPYLKIVDLDEKVEDKIGDKLLVSGGSKSYNDATGETTITITGSGLTAEQVLDTTAYTIKVGDGLQKTKDDAGDSILIELKLKDALERIVWSTGCHKSVFMATNTTGGTAHWGFQITGTGTVTAPTKSTTNRFQFANRWETLITTPSATAAAGFRTNSTTHGFGNASGMGGFYYNGVTGAATGLSNTNARYFSGFSSYISAPIDANPSSLNNIIGIGYDSSDGNLQFMHNDGSGTASKVDLGSNFAVTTTDRTNFYRLIMYAESNGSTVYFKVIDMTDGDTYTGSVNTNLPSNTTMFGPYGYTSVGGTSAVTGFALMQLEVFSDF